MKAVLLPLVAAAILCSLAASLTPEGRSRAAVTLTAALVMAAAVLRPIADVAALTPGVSPDQIQRQAELARQEGERAAENLYRSFIAQELETYIVQQAETLGIQISVHLVLDEQGLPKQITVTGRWSPEEKTQLEQLITRDLGLKPDRQIYLEEGVDLP